MYFQQIDTQLLVEIQGVETTALSKNSADKSKYLFLKNKTPAFSLLDSICHGQMVSNLIFFRKICSYHRGEQNILWQQLCCLVLFTTVFN